MSQTLKTIDAGEGRVGGYLIVWGHPQQRDLQGEYFTPETDLALGWYPVRPVLFHHGLPTAAPPPGGTAPDIVGTLVSLRPDENGVYAEAVLNPDHPFKAAVMRLIDDGLLGWSSGSLPHLVQVADDGRIVRWPIVEGSLTPRPAEPQRTRVQRTRVAHTHHADVSTLTGAYKALGLDTSPLGLGTGNGGAADLPEHESNEETIPMEFDNNEHLSSATRSQGLKRLPVASAEDARAVKTAISVSSPYDKYDALDLLHGYMMLRNVKTFQGVSERYANALAHKIRTQRLSAVKSDELSYSTQTGYGDEWVPDLWSDQIWQKARLDNVVLPLFRAVEMPSNPFELPVEGTDPAVYFVPETRDEAQLTFGATNPIPSSKIGSGKVRLSAQKLALRVGFTSELVEDAILPVLNIYREQSVRAIADSIDYALLNGDTETLTNGNINAAAGTPTGNERYLAFDGLRKLPLVTNPANSVAMSGAPTLAKLRETRFKMATRYAARPSDLAWLVDGSTYAALLSLPEFLTMDKAGALATAQTGQIGFIDGIPVFVTAEMPLTDATGVVAGTGNTKGTALCVYRPGWFVGYRRRIAVSVDYLPYYDSYQLTATVRLAFANYDDDVAAALVNVTV